MDAQCLDWLRVARSRLPDGAKRLLLERYPDPARALTADFSRISSAARLPGSGRLMMKSFCDAQAVARDRAWLKRTAATVVGLTDPHYPRLLRQIPDPPVVLYCLGDTGLLQVPALAIVGSRNPTPVGREIARNLARQLAGGGAVIVSGLAVGIDGAAHQGALDAKGATIAVCATGLDTVYPRYHQQLAGLIGHSGLLVSEFPPGTGVKRYHFPRRNRIISGLTLGTLIVEAARKSGSLITAFFAAEQGREVLAVPGSIHSPLSRGPHRLLRDGARLVESIADILEELPALGMAPAASDSAAAGSVRANPVLDAVDFAPTSVDQIMERSGLTITEVCAMLIRMELAGAVRSCAGGYIRLPG